MCTCVCVSVWTTREKTKSNAKDILPAVKYIQHSMNASTLSHLADKKSPSVCEGRTWEHKNAAHLESIVPLHCGRKDDVSSEIIKSRG